ncbi:MAG: alanine racemase [Putridiphycobacter sp.]|nr:alanine racemase [Putridiphycobacter sp.]
MSQTSFITISKSALKTNIDFIQTLLGDTEFSAVVKGNAYGHGIEVYCPVMVELGVTHFSVFSVHEAMRLKAILPNHINIMIMGHIDLPSLEWVITNDISFFVFEKNRLKKSIDISKKVGKKAKVHIEIETGMNRTGFEMEFVKNLIQYLEKHKTWIEVEGVCSHLAGAESISNYKRIKKQIKNFNLVKDRFVHKTDFKPKFHLACSAAALQYPKTKLDLARIGILQYGFFPSNEVLVQYLTKHNSQVNPLKRVISWRTEVMDINTVKPGEFVGYGTSYFTNAYTTIALIPVGYAHGFSRSLSNQGKVLIQGKRFDVVGTVNMNMTAIDIAGCDDIKIGDEVVLIGMQGDLEISVASFGDFSNLLNYELLTRLPESIERKIIE